jgi:hypothetical protein
MTSPFRPDELGSSGGAADSAELASALEAARLLERAVGVDGVQPSPDFASRVMAAVATQPAPSRSRLAMLLGSVRAAWDTALSANQPPFLRARAIAIVLIVILALGSLGGAATLAAAGALNLIGPHPSTTPLITPGPVPNPSGPTTTSPNPAATHEPTESEGPSETPDASETPEPTETPEPPDH